MTLIKDLIEIPERVQRGDFVLNLASGVEQAEQTLRNYVVTPQLASCFDDALSFTKSAVTAAQNRNKGAYLHGSFGSGKSHFMAVLHLLLQGNTVARGIAELSQAVKKHDDWMQSKNCLLVPYHMIGAESVESGVLGGMPGISASCTPRPRCPAFISAAGCSRTPANCAARWATRASLPVCGAPAPGTTAAGATWSRVGTRPASTR
jgi:hypothetical protein